MQRMISVLLRGLALVLLSFTAPTYSTLAEDCPAEPDCPIATTKVCRRACPSGGSGYFYQYGSNCLDGTEPVNGHCEIVDRALTYRTGGGTATMLPAARRPGQRFHSSSYSVEWRCESNPPLDPPLTTPPTRNFTFTYSRLPWGGGAGRSHAMSDARFDSADWDAFMRGLDHSRLNYGPCLEEMRRKIRSTFSSNCETVEIAAGLQPEIARGRCRDEQVDRYYGPIRHRITRKLIAAEQAMGRDPLLPMQPANSGQLSMLTYMASNLANCSPNPRYMPQEYRDRLFTREFMTDHLPGVIQNTTAACKRTLLEIYLDKLADVQIPDCRGRRSDSPCVQIRRATRSALSALTTAYNGARDDAGRTIFQYRQSVAACVTASHDPATVIRDLQLNSELAGQCVDLRFRNPRESRVVNAQDVGTGIDAKYRLTRTGNKSYRVDLNLQFTPATEQATRTRFVNGCLREANKYLKGPNDQTLQLALTTDASVPSNPIEIMTTDDFRSHSAAWERDIGCKTVTHELMHLLGLVDEYHERSSGYVYNTRTGVVDYHSQLPDRRGADEEFTLARDCRVHGPSNSLMSSHWEAFDAVDGWAGTGWFRDRTSLLYPAHFNAITHPGCFARNRTYYRCARFAYQDSIGHHGQGCESGRPTECQDGASWLGGGE